MGGSTCFNIGTTIKEHIRTEVDAKVCSSFERNVSLSTITCVAGKRPVRQHEDDPDSGPYFVIYHYIFHFSF